MQCRIIYTNDITDENSSTVHAEESDTDTDTDIYTNNTTENNSIRNSKLSIQDSCGESLKDEDEEEDDGELEEISSKDILQKQLVSPIIKSLFSNELNVIRFPNENERLCKSLPKISTIKWKANQAPNVVKGAVKRVGFEISKSKHWFGYWGKHWVSDKFISLLPFQKINHFPMSFEIGRKDKMYNNWEIMKNRMSVEKQKDLDFCPKSFQIPKDRKKLKKEFKRHPQWIIKPPASARGLGIKVINRWTDVPRKKALIVSKYINNPLLIDNRKFDLRLYVLVTSFDPLIIYLHEEGIVRFCVDPYKPLQGKKNFKNKYSHLTNYSISKKKIIGKDVPKNHISVDEDTRFNGKFDTRSCKWDFSTLKQYFSTKGIDYDLLFDKIKGLIIKSMISVQANGCKVSLQDSSISYELFGYDVLIDDNLKPWLMEVNISPSLKSSCILDHRIKSKVIVDIFNLVGFTVKNLKNYTLNTQNVKKAFLNSRERQKHKDIMENNLKDCLQTLEADDIRVLQRVEDEYRRKGSFNRLYPENNALEYKEYFQNYSYYIKLLTQWNEKMNHAERVDKLKTQLKVGSISLSNLKEGLKSKVKLGSRIGSSVGFSSSKTLYSNQK